MKPLEENSWSRALRRYLVWSLSIHLAWEIAHLPLYTLWTTGTLDQKSFAVIHCTIGDVMIAGLSLLIAFAVIAPSTWPAAEARSVWLMTVLLGMGYTIYSEWLNVNVRGSWAYSGLMPTLPMIGTGLSPLLQWLVVPTLVLWISVGRAPWIDREQSGSS